MDEALLCDRIALIKEGVILNSDTPAGIVSSFKSKLLAVWGDNMPKLLNEIRSYEYVKSVYSFGHEHHVTVDLNNYSHGLTDRLAKALNERGYDDFHIKEIDPGI